MHAEIRLCVGAHRQLMVWQLASLCSQAECDITARDFALKMRAEIECTANMAEQISALPHDWMFFAWCSCMHVSCRDGRLSCVAPLNSDTLAVVLEQPCRYEARHRVRFTFHLFHIFPCRCECCYCYAVVAAESC